MYDYVLGPFCAQLFNATRHISTNQTKDHFQHMTFVSCSMFTHNIS